MRVLLDECVPRLLKKYLTGFEVHTVTQMGWSGKKNGALLKLMQEARFDVFITVDANLTYQQNLKGTTLAICILKAKSNDIDDLLCLVPELKKILPETTPGRIYVIK